MMQLYSMLFNQKQEDILKFKNITKLIMLTEAYSNYTPRYEGDQQYDIRTVVQPIVEQLVCLKLNPII